MPTREGSSNPSWERKGGYPSGKVTKMKPPPASATRPKQSPAAGTGPKRGASG